MIELARRLLIASLAAASPLIAQVPVHAAGAPVDAGKTPPLVPANFAVPTKIAGPGFQLVPLGPDVVQIDYDAYMSSIEHLQQTFTHSTAWPRKDILRADAMQDMKQEQARFESRTSFAFAVLTPDGRRERGSVYISRSPVPQYDAVVRMWVTKAEYDAGFDAQLYKWVTAWVRKDWPFRNVAYPGRSIDMATWNAMVAANAPAKVKP